MTKLPKRIHAIVHGRVQGVSFRYNTMLKAHEIGVVGWVRNLADGTVEVVAEGDHESLDMLVEFLRIGPLGAHVTNLELNELEADGTFSDFHVR